MPKIHVMGCKGPRGGDLLLFWCPGCDRPHPFEVNCADRGWSWDGDIEKPTFSPSLLCSKDFPESRCHSFVRGGRIEFLSDCHHPLAGQTVDLPDWPESA